MANREMVIAGLKCIADGCVNACGSVNKCVRDVAKDAFELLEKDEPVKISARRRYDGSIVWICGECGQDLAPNNSLAKYCSNCGKAVKWSV